MLSVVTKESSERAAIIELGVSETGLSEAILEKDLWVCYLLDYLFQSRYLLSQEEIKKARRASDLEVLVAGAGFEPTTSGL